jgi:hypothetical protein
MGVLSSELRRWIVPGQAGVIAITDSDGSPLVARVWAARAIDGCDVIEVFVQRSSALPLLGALAESCRAALNLIEITTYRSRMFKGSCELASHEADPVFGDASVAALGRAFHSVGLPPDGAERMLAHGGVPRTMVALRLTVESVFDQSPKPGAGARL